MGGGPSHRTRPPEPKTPHGYGNYCEEDEDDDGRKLLSEYSQLCFDGSVELLYDSSAASYIHTGSVCLTACLSAGHQTVRPIPGVDRRLRSLHLQR